MLLFQRKIDLISIPSKCFSIIQLILSIGVFRQPFSIFKSYVFKKPLSQAQISLKNGLNVFLTASVEDVITAVVVFAKKEYGHIEQGSIVVDIGANVGMFSLYAAEKGASKIYAIECNDGNYKLLEKNIKKNNKASTIIPIFKAFSNHTISELYVTKFSTPYSHVKKELSDTSNFDIVKTIHLKELIHHYQLDKIDLLKMDCEAAEHDIIPFWDVEDLKIIKEIRMELHPNPNKKDRYLTLNNLLENGFEKTKDESDIVWLKNTLHF